MQNVIKLLGDLVSFDTSDPTKGNKQIVDFVINYLKQFPINIDLIKSSYSESNTLFAYPKYSDKIEILFSGHLDVVSVKNQNWKTDPFKIRVQDNKVYGRGTSDMKGFISCILNTIPKFIQDKIPFALAFTYDEETYCKSIQELMDNFSYFTPKLVLLGEPTQMNIDTMHKGVCDVQIDIQGLAAHSSNPDKGINSILIASEIIQYLKILEEKLKKENDAVFIPSNTTINIGSINGGTSANSVPEFCSFKWDIRPISEKHIDFILNTVENFITKLEEQTNAKINMQKTCNMPFFNNININVGGLHSGTTEAGFYQKNGMSAIICGPGNSEQAHKADEYILIEQLEKCCKFLECFEWRKYLK